MEIVRIDIPKNLLAKIIASEQLSFNDIELVKVDVPDFDYSKTPLWVAQKKVSTDAYNKLKEIEFNIRNHE